MGGTRESRGGETDVINPTVGRIVWYRPDDFDRASMTIIDPEQPMAATVAYVATNTCVNLAVTDHGGDVHQRIHVHLAGQGIADRCSWDWMPYQKGQAAKTEALERAQAPSGP